MADPTTKLPHGKKSRTGELDLAKSMPPVSGPVSDGTVPPTVWEDFDWTDFTEMERKFVELYCANPTSAKDAAIDAGYSKKTAASTACQLLKVPRIHTAISMVLSAMHARIGLTEQTILYELFLLMTSNIDDFVVDEFGNVSCREGVPEYAKRAIKGITHTVTRAKDGSVSRTSTLQLWDKPSAIRMAGQYRKMFTEKVDVNVDVNVKQIWKVGDRTITF